MPRAGDRVDLQRHLSALSDARPFPLASGEASAFVRNLVQSQRSGPRGFRRGSTRYAMDGREVSVSVVHPGGSIAAFRCALLDLSAGGASFVYPGFLHHSTECVVHLDRQKGEPAAIAGSTVWCRFVSRSLHTIGVTWSEAIDPREFIPPKQWLEQAAPSDEQAQAELRGRLLAVGVSAIEQNLVQALLTETSVEVLFADSPGDAMDHLHQELFDVILVDADRLGTAWTEFLNLADMEGFAEPALIVSSPNAADEAKNVSQKNVLVEKPLLQPAFMAALEEVLTKLPGQLDGSSPIFSELPNADSRVEMLTDYVLAVRRLRDELISALNADNACAAKKAAQSMLNTALGFGFPVLSAAAEKAIVAIDASGSASESAASIRQVSRVVERLHVTGQSRSNVA